MVEPVAAVLFNSLLSGRSTLNYSPSLQSVTRAMTRPLRPTLTPCFFTPQPQPRRVNGKGKEKATEHPGYEFQPEYSSRCQEWSCAMRHSFWCLSKSLVMVALSFRSHNYYHRRDVTCFYGGDIAETDAHYATSIAAHLSCNASGYV